MKSLIVELFAPGKWNGYTFTIDDLKEMANNFDFLKGVQFAPIKLGHNKKQDKTDGEPALGEIGGVWVSPAGKDGKPKLMGKLVGLPDIVYDAIKKKLYNKVSIELDLDVNYKSKYMKYVLTGVALLGADLPAVNTLADLKAYMGRKSLFTSGSTQLCFSQDSLNVNNEKEVLQMDEFEKLCLQFGVQGKDSTALAAFITGLQTDNDKLKLDVIKFTNDERVRKEEEEKAAIKLSRDTITAKFEKAVSDKVITPAQRDQFTKLLNVDDDSAVVKIKTEAVDDLLKSEGGKNMFSKNSSQSHNDGGRNSSDAGEELTAKAQEIVNNSNGSIDFSRALTQAMRAHPDLAKEHVANQPV